MKSFFTKNPWSWYLFLSRCLWYGNVFTAPKNWWKNN